MIIELNKGRKPKNLKVRYEKESNDDSMMDDQSILGSSEEDSEGVNSDKFVKRVMKAAGSMVRQTSQKMKQTSFKLPIRDHLQDGIVTGGGDYAEVPRLAPLQRIGNTRNIPTSV